MFKSSAEALNLNSGFVGGYTPLHAAAERGHEMVMYVLLDHGADVNSQDDEGAAPLHYASGAGYEQLCDILLRHGADANMQEKKGYTALHYAAAAGKERVASVLLYHGAKINVKQEKGWTPLVIAQSSGHDAVADVLLSCLKGAPVALQHSVSRLPLASHDAHLASSPACLPASCPVVFLLTCAERKRFGPAGGASGAGSKSGGYMKIPNTREHTKKLSETVTLGTRVKPGCVWIAQPESYYSSDSSGGEVLGGAKNQNSFSNVYLHSSENRDVPSHMSMYWGNLKARPNSTALGRRPAGMRR